MNLDSCGFSRGARFVDTVEVVVVGEGNRSESGVDGEGDDLCRLIGAVGSIAVQVEIYRHLEHE